jgi:hypothetical protein
VGVLGSLIRRLRQPLMLMNEPGVAGGDLAAHGLDHAPGRVRREDRDLPEPSRVQQLPVLFGGALLPATEEHQHVEVQQGRPRLLVKVGAVLRREHSEKGTRRVELARD